MLRIIITLIFPLVVFAQIECAPCSINANSDLEITKIKSDWPEINQGELIKVNSLTNVLYENDDKYWEIWDRKPWWTNQKSDPWIDGTDWTDNYIEPNHNFEDCVNDSLRWLCGYSYVLRIPKNFKKNKKYPLVIFLHGGISSNARSLTRRAKSIENFYMPENDEYIIAAPIKLGVDWSPKRIQDVVNDVQSNMKINNKRIYLTGLSMGGRGTFIVAAQLPNLFAAIMPFSPHHQPYSYVDLSEKIKHIPTYLHHSKNDKTSKFSVAELAYNELSKINNNVEFNIGNSGHSGWGKLYADKEIINWLLSWKKNKK